MTTSKSTAEIQEMYLIFMLSNPTLYTRVQNIFNPENFDKSLRSAARFIKQHVNDYSAMPTTQQVNAVAGTHLEKIDGIVRGHEEWFLEDFEKFTRMEELERAILKCADLLNKGEFDPVEKIIKDAVQITLTKDLGIDYFQDPRQRLMRIMNTNGQVSTGWKDLDDKLYGGMNRGELNIFCGLPNAGKSLFLQNIALNWMSKGLHGVYITLEMSEDLIAMRLDSMLTGIGSRDIFKNLDDVEIKVHVAGNHNGKLKIKYMPAQSTTNQIRAYIKELSIQENFEPDFVCVDYLDLLMPSGAKVDVGDAFTKDKLISEELRNYFAELKALGVTASQINRTGVDEIELSVSSIAGGFSKLNTADNLFAIYTSRIMKERGAIQLQLLKTRNSGGVGSKVDFDFNVDSLRITDSTQAPDNASPFAGINVKAKIKNLPTTPEAKKDQMSEMVASLLGKIKTQ